MGKKTVIFIVAVTLIVLIAGWYVLQNVMTNYNVDEDAFQPHQWELTHLADSKTGE
ncbi:hypothetical protein SAMN05216238_107194 [Lentibacillus persicus]|uniref:Tumour necrosis factor receptor superfamily member 19 n=1 Tax=Lentibacillus persicus TaxID=640948 RepID=A0A1I1XG85_9BACI|nr:hypothetical protein [Lentibacillus persicus]SFE04773.1 hypothetical protein SAMN05216238_107194 [Lentibacillus persicus]